MDARAAVRAEGRPRRKGQPDMPMASMGDAMKAGMEARKKIADTQKKDAS